MTRINLTAGGVQLSLLFLSPITPSDYVRQSLPYSYLDVEVHSLDGGSHDVQLYSDISAEWACGDWSREVTWATSTLGDNVVHQFELATPDVFGEVQDFALWGQTVYATAQSDALTTQSGPATDVRALFVSQGALDDSQDSAFRAISDNTPVLAFAHALGTVAPGASGSVRYVVGHFLEPAFSYTAVATNNSDRSLYFMAQYPTLESSLSFFMTDYEYALQQSRQFDLALDVAATGLANSEYSSVVALVARQVYTGLSITIGRDASGELDTGDIMVFVKEISTSNYVNTVDILYPTHWMFLYLDPPTVRHMLEPVLRYSETIDLDWGVHDIGRAWPVADGAVLDSPYYIEESGNLIFMTLAYTRASGDTAFASEYYDLLVRYGNWLTDNTIFPASQASTDDFNGEVANATNLVAKGIVGLGALGELATVLGNTDDAARFNQTATTLAGEFLEYGLSTDGSHFKVTYDMDDSSWATVYNLYPDRFFSLGLFDDELHDTLGAWYESQANEYGVPLDSRHDYAKLDWAMLMAASYKDTPAVRDAFLGGVHDYLAYGATPQAAPDLYDTLNASALPFVDRPVVGAVFALLAQNTSWK